ncbi:DUF4292 domain-containing protein [Candidatus Latescibacterota bacterium]
MKNIVCGWFTAFITILLFAVQGCGLKPDIGVPDDITPEQVISAIKRQTQTVETFSGTASVKVSANGSSEDATVVIRYINPGLFRLYLKGFAGIDLGRISALEDSITVYIPSENIYLKAGRDEYILEKLFPEINLDVKMVELLFNGTFRAEFNRAGFSQTIACAGDQAELSIVNEKGTFQYLVAGPDLQLIREEFLIDGAIVWRKTLSEYKSYDGVEFPQDITIERGEDSFSVKFSKCEINTGLSAPDLTFAIPPSAERVYIENSR